MEWLWGSLVVLVGDSVGVLVGVRVGVLFGVVYGVSCSGRCFGSCFGRVIWSVTCQDFSTHTFTRPARQSARTHLWSCRDVLAEFAVCL